MCGVLVDKAMFNGIQVEVAHTSGLLDTDVPSNEKLYGYHRLDDPLVVITNEKVLIQKQSELVQLNKIKPVLIDKHDSHLKKIK